MPAESNWEIFHKARWRSFLEHLKSESSINSLVKDFFNQSIFIGVDYRKRKVVMDGRLVDSTSFLELIESEKPIWILSLIKYFPECNDLFIAEPIKIEKD